MTDLYNAEFDPRATVEAVTDRRLNRVGTGVSKLAINPSVKEAMQLAAPKAEIIPHAPIAAEVQVTVPAAPAELSELDRLVAMADEARAQLRSI